MSLHHLLFLAYILKIYAGELVPLRDEVPSLVALVTPEPTLPLGPVLREEPPPLVPVHATGTRLRCVAAGNPPPRISWLAADGSALQDEPGVRRVLGDGSLQVWVVSDGRGEQILRCRASNTRGAVLSRPVTLLSVPAGGLASQVEARGASAGGVAVLRCRALGAGGGAGAVRNATWYRDGAVFDTASEPRYLAAGDTLLIRDMSQADAAPYSCVPSVQSAPSPTRASRSRPVSLALLTGGGGGAAPRLPTAGDLTVASGDRFCLTCAAPDFPPPKYTWYREHEGRLQPVGVTGSAGPTAGLVPWAGGAALCGRAATELAGAWLCKAYNSFGDATLQLRLHVEAELSVTVTPVVLVARPGGAAELSCRSSAPAALSWWHDGVPLPATGGRLVLRGVTRAHAGMYQCEATRGRSTALAAAELRLADSAPELQYTFIEQALRPGTNAALRCTAAASPAPRIAWLLDGHSLDRFLPHHRYSVTEQVASAPDAITSLLNVSVSTADGGRYTCRAHNALGAAEHSARLDVYGPPAVRALGAVHAVAGDNVTLYCPYFGYPISSVWWRRAGGGAAVTTGAGGATGAGVAKSAGVAAGAALHLRPVRAHDAGRYTCGVSAPGGATATGDIDLQVRNPPKISPFMFSSELTEGSAAQALCGVSAGDKPLHFSWLKDSRPLPTDLQIEEKSLNDFSLLVFPALTARHSGAYTCRVANHAAVANFTATLTVKVVPAWVTEPADAAVLLGAPLRLKCTARGRPAPTLTWHRRLGGAAEEAERWEAIGASWGASVDGAAAFLSASAGIAAGAAGTDLGSAQLTAPNATRGLQGAYRCTADNGVGAPLTKEINVAVHEAAHFADAVPRNVSGVRGTPVALECEARGDAPLAVQWTHRGANLRLDSYRWTVSEARAVGGVRSTLQLGAAGREDAGEYRCRAHNRFGSSERIIFLQVEEPPDAPSSIQLAGASSRWIRVRWRARDAGGTGDEGGVRYWAECTPLRGDTAPPLNLTLDAKEEGGPDSQGYRMLSALVAGVRPAAAYAVRVVATNRVGRSPRSEPLLVTTLDEAPSGPPQNVRVRSVDKRELHVSWSAPVQHTWNGELVGYAVWWREVGGAGAMESAEGVTGAGVAPGAELSAGRSVVRGWGGAELRVRDLREFARYEVTLRAFNAAGLGPPSQVVYATIADGVPETAPGDLWCAAESARALRVRWTPPPAPAPSPSGYDVLYAPFYNTPTWSGAGADLTLGGVSGSTREALLAGLRAHTNYSVRVRARTTSGPGPPSAARLCTTLEDVPGAVATLRAVAVSASAVRVSWLAPTTAARLTHYTLHVRELGRVGGEWSQHVELSSRARRAGVGGRGVEEDEQEECSAEVAGLRARAAFEFRVRAHAATGVGPVSRAAAASTPGTDTPVSARIWSLSREVMARVGGRVRLRCAAAGAAPLARLWTPLPPMHAIAEDGDLLLHKVESEGNYTCSVRNAAGADRAVLAVVLRRPPAAPAPRLLRTDAHALHLAWDEPPRIRDPVLGYSVWWRRSWEDTAAEEARSTRTARRQVALRGLSCGARYAVWLHAHNALGASPPSRTLTLRTKGDKLKAPLGKDFIWANSSALRLNLVAWGGGDEVCAATRWALRVGAADLATDGQTATATNLDPGTWYEIRVRAFSPAGETTAFYRAATLTLNGERIGSPSEVSVQESGTEDAGGGAAGGVGHGAAAAGLCGAALALLTGATLAAARCRRRRTPHAHPSIKKLPIPDGELQEISPYATFSMASSATSGTRGCELRLHAPALAEPLAAPPRSHPHRAHAQDYCSGSDSSGSPCAACAAELYRVPAAHLADTLPATDWGSTGREGTRRGTRRGVRVVGGPRRREPEPAATARFSPRTPGTPRDRPPTAPPPAVALY